MSPVSEAGRVVVTLMRASAVLAIVMLAVVAIERVGFAVQEARRRRMEFRYRPLIVGAVSGDPAALRALVASAPRHRVALATLLIVPLIEDRDPARIEATRSIVRAMSVMALVDRYLRSRLWWRRALALRAAGLIRDTDRTPVIVAALDDPHADVRAAALDALADLHDPASLPAIVVRLNDETLHRGRRAAALAAFGADGEPFLLDLASVDPAHLRDYAHALAICGTRRSRTALTRWAGDPRAPVQAAAFEALGRIGLDDAAARRAIAALDSGDAGVRATAAAALAGWTGGGAAEPLARHLDDAWPVAARAARTLRSMGRPGLAELQARAGRDDLVGLLAREMLWQKAARC